MNQDGVAMVTVESPVGCVDLLVDAHRPLTELLPALAAATGAPAHGRWTVTEGQRQLHPVAGSAEGRTLTELRVVAGAVLRLSPI